MFTCSTLAKRDGATSNAEFFETGDRALIAHGNTARAIGILNPPTFDRGFVAVPDGPGLGIKLDRDQAENVTVGVFK